MKILIAVDVHDHAQEVLDEATPWVERLSATADLGFVGGHGLVNPFITDPHLRKAIEKEWERVQERDQAAVEALLERLPEAVRGRARALTGRPADALIAASEEYDAIVVGTHGRQGMSRVWMGSVTEEVARRAPVPVLVLHLK